MCAERRTPCSFATAAGDELWVAIATQSADGLFVDGRVLRDSHRRDGVRLADRPHLSR